MAEASSRSLARPGQASDLLFLSAVVVLSVLPYVWRLGFYSDDWASLGAMTSASDQSIAGLVKAQLASDQDAAARLTNTVYQALLFDLFGLNPLGYHVINALVFVSIALLAYLTLREVGVDRTVAVATAAVYTLLPNYSTDRFWFIAFAYGSSMTLLLAGAYAFLRAARSQRLVPWTALGVLCLTAAALGMEVVVPLMLAIPAAVLWQWYRLSPFGLRQAKTVGGFLVLVGPLAVLAAVAVYKGGTARGFNVPDIFYMMRLVIGSLAVNFGTYGVALPHTVAWSIPQLTTSSAAVGTLLALLVFAYLYRSRDLSDSRHLWPKIMLAGAGISMLGTAIFTVSSRVGFWSAGMANRVWIAAAFGTALVLVGASGWVSSKQRERLRGAVFALSIAALCLSGFVINTGISGYWIAAWPLQRDVLEDVRRALPDIPSGTTLLLTGVCPYAGPAVVFESPWDLSGALRVLYRDSTLRADVLVDFPADRFRIADDGLWTNLYGRAYFYRYGGDLLLFDRHRGMVVPLTDSGVAHAHLVAPLECGEGIEGRGTLRLPVDTWYHNLMAIGSSWRSRSGL